MDTGYLQFQSWSEFLMHYLAELQPQGYTEIYVKTGKLIHITDDEAIFLAIQEIPNGESGSV